MSTSSPPTTHDGDNFVCECEDWMRSACAGEIFYKEHDGKRYCVLHYPGGEKKEDFQRALERKIDEGDFDFQGVWFPDVISFKDVTFSADADFSGAQFSADADFIDAQFSANAYFMGAQFSANAYFSGAQFCADADFSGAQFSANAYFSGAQFSTYASFSNAVFNGNVFFNGTNFIEKDGSPGGGANSNDKAISPDDGDGAKANVIHVPFDGARFKDGVSFKENRFGDWHLLHFDAAVFEKPERVTFHTVTLRPHWFINVDPRKLNFIHVPWKLTDKRDTVRQEIRSRGNIKAEDVPGLQEITFRQLAVNAEENNRYEEAASFRYMAMNVRHMEGWRRFNFFRISWWYWLLSGYGERVPRAFVALLTIWLLFAVFYWTGNAAWWKPRQASRTVAENIAVENQTAPNAAPLTFPEAIIYSGGVMALQKPEPLPANKRAKGLVLLETILGPLQAALLALAIRRKFMR